MVSASAILSVREDKDTISELMHRYCVCLDDGRFAELAGLFAADGVWIAPYRTVAGPAEIEAWLIRSVPAAATARSNYLLMVDGSVASVCGTYADFADERFDLVVNATSASLHGELPPLAPQVFGPGCLAYELFYGNGLTPFLRLARNAGAHQLADGVGMLVEQAAEAFEWWRGVRPQTKDLIRQLTVSLR